MTDIRRTDTYNIPVVQALPERNIRLKVDDDREVEEDEADHQVLVNGEAGTAKRSEGAENIHADEEEQETDDGETEVSVGHYDGEDASVVIDRDVDEALGVVSSRVPVPTRAAVLPGQAWVTGTAQVRDQGAGDGCLGVRGGGGPAENAVIVPPAPVCNSHHNN